MSTVGLQVTMVGTVTNSEQQRRLSAISTIFDLWTLVFICLGERRSVGFGDTENTFIAVGMSKMSYRNQYQRTSLLFPVYGTIQNGSRKPETLITSG